MLLLWPLMAAKAPKFKSFSRQLKRGYY